MPSNPKPGARRHAPKQWHCSALRLSPMACGTCELTPLCVFLRVDSDLYRCPPHLRCPKCIEARAPCYIRALQAVHNRNLSNGHGVFLWARLACRDCYWGRGGRGSCPYNMDKASFRIDSSEEVPANRLKLVSTLRLMTNSTRLKTTKSVRPTSVLDPGVKLPTVRSRRKAQFRHTAS